jgi:hypothetical protein
MDYHQMLERKHRSPFLRRRAATFAESETMMLRPWRLNRELDLAKRPATS